MTELSIAIGVVGLAGVLAAWHTARAWMRHTDRRAHASALEAKLAAQALEIGDRIEKRFAVELGVAREQAKERAFSPRRA